MSRFYNIWYHSINTLICEWDCNFTFLGLWIDFRAKELHLSEVKSLPKFHLYQNWLLECKHVSECCEVFAFFSLIFATIFHTKIRGRTFSKKEKMIWTKTSRSCNINATLKRIKLHLCNKGFKILQVELYLFLDGYKHFMDDDLELWCFFNVF